MDHEEKFWVSVWAIAAFVAVAVIGMAFVHNASKNEQVVRMVAAGAHPITAMCAISGIDTTGEAAICAKQGDKQ